MHLNPEMVSKNIRFNLSEIESQLKQIVSESFNFAKSHSKVLQKGVKQPQPEKLVKDPALFDYKKSLAVHSDNVTCLEMLFNGNFVSGSADASIVVWDPIKYQKLKRFEGHTNTVTQVLELTNGNLASASLDGSVNVWDRHASEIVQTIEGFKLKVVALLELSGDNLVILNEGEADFSVWNYMSDAENNHRYYQGH